MINSLFYIVIIFYVIFIFIYFHYKTVKVPFSSDKTVSNINFIFGTDNLAYAIISYPSSIFFSPLLRSISENDYDLYYTMYFSLIFVNLFKRKMPNRKIFFSLSLSLYLIYIYTHSPFTFVGVR